jgi:hypothetical protein
MPSPFAGAITAGLIAISWVFDIDSVILLPGPVFLTAIVISEGWPRHWIVAAVLGALTIWLALLLAVFLGRRFRVMLLVLFLICACAYILAEFRSRTDSGWRD